MKYGRTLEELAMELTRQMNAKKDYLVDTRRMRFDANKDGAMLSLNNDVSGVTTLLRINEVAHNQIGTSLGIPAKYYDKMRRENPSLLATNVNSWFDTDPEVRMVRTLDGTARAFLSKQYRRIDNYEVAMNVLPIIADMPEANVESCEITDSRMYIKVVNPRLTTEVVPGDIVQSGILITNSEVGMGSLTVQPLVYRLVCRNGMVVNDAKTSQRHVGRGNMAEDDFTLYTDETLKADDHALMLKVRDTVKAVVDQTRFDRVVNMMRQAKDAKITTSNIPAMIELASEDFKFSKPESTNILDHLIRGGDLSLYGLANAVTRSAQDVESYDRSTTMEAIGYNILNMSASKWNRLNAVSAVGSVA